MPSLGLTGATVAPASEGWWQEFGDPQLDRLIRQALSDNPGLAQAGARLRLARGAGRGSARGRAAGREIQCR